MTLFPHTSPNLFAHRLPTRLTFCAIRGRMRTNERKPQKVRLRVDMRSIFYWLSGAFSSLKRSWERDLGFKGVKQGLPWWFGSHLTMQWTQVQSLDWEDPRRKYGGLSTDSLCSATREASTSRSPRPAAKKPHTSQLEKARTKQDPAQPESTSIKSL